jgi:hypothetical protein
MEEKMKVDLNKKDLSTLVRGLEPSYELMEHPKVAKCGKFCGGFREEWSWNNYFDDNMTEEQLWELYCILTKRKEKVV